MPTYGYRCPKGHEFEIWQSMTDDAAANCPECGEPARRLFFPAGIVFKGSGFYKTDSRSGNSIPATSSTPAPAKPSETKSDTESGTAASGSAPAKDTPAKPATDTKSKPKK